jgi:winged helix DNA-binding protein
VTARTLGPRALNRALLARQLLLERSSLSLVDALEQVGGLQTQYSPSGYVGLWSRLAAFRREHLTAALEDRSAIQATLMRVTIHTVSRREFWLFAAGVRRARRVAATRIRTLPSEAELRARAGELAAALADGPRSVGELGPVATGFLGTVGTWVDLVRVPPSGTWERRRADRLALAEQWVGPDTATEEEGLTHLVRACLRGFGPARWAEIAGWAGIPVADARRGGANLALVAYLDESGRELVDLPGAPLPDAASPAPVRFLAHFDNSLLVHFRRTSILPEEHRSKIFSIRNPASVGTVLVDGRVVASWSVREGRVVVEELEPIGPRDRDAIEAERAALQAFHG